MRRPEVLLALAQLAACATGNASVPNLASLAPRAPATPSDERSIAVNADRSRTEAEPYFGERGQRAKPSVDPNDVLFWNRWRDESIELDDFMELTSEADTAEASFGSEDYLDDLLKQDAHLYRTRARKHWLHVKPDQLLHRYDFGGLPLLVYENSRYVTVRVAATPEADESPEAFVQRITGSLFRNPVAPWYFFPTSAPDESLRFSTFEDYSPEKSGRQIGVAGAIVTGGLYFTTYRYDGRYQGISPPPLINQRLRDLWAKHRPAAAGAP